MNSKENMLRPAARDGTPWVTEARTVRVLQEKKTSRHATPPRRTSVQTEMLVIIGIHLSALLIKKEVANMGISVRSSIPKKCWKRTEGAKDFCGSRENIGHHT